MSEVSCRILAPVVEAVDQAGCPPGALVEGLSLAPEVLLRTSNRIRWDEFTAILENAARQLGGPEGLEEAAASYYERTGSMLGAIAANVSSARPLYHLGARWYGPTLFTATRATCVDAPDGRIRQEIEILPGFRPSPLFFLTMRGALRGTPTMLGQERAQVDMRTEGERRAVFLITPPPSLTLWARLRRSLFPNRDLERAVAEGEEQLDALRHGYEVARRATELLSFQAAQLEAEQQQVRRGEDAARRTAELLSVQSARLEAREKELRTGDEVARRAADLLSVQTARLAAEQRERTQVEERLLEAQQLETLGRMTVTAAPDLGRAFTGIGDDLEAALERLEPDHPVRGALDGIRAAADRGVALVGRLVAVGGPESAEPGRVVLDELLLSLEPVLRKVLPVGIQVAVFPAGGPLEVLADPSQLRQAVLALALNARDAMPEGGRLEIHLCRADRAEGQGDLARIEVRDTGGGMDAETLERALEPFYTTKASGQGSGLGLPAVQAIVQRVGGAVRLESEPGKGSVVVLLLPLAS